MKKILSVLILFLALLPLVAAPKTGKTPIVIKKGYTVPEWVKTVVAGNPQQIKLAFDIPDTRRTCVIMSKEDTEELSKCSAVIEMYSHLIGYFVTYIPTPNDESGNLLNKSSKATTLINGFYSDVTSEYNENGTRTFVKTFKSPFSFESEVTSIESNSTVNTTYKYLVNGTKKTDKNITYADLAGLKNEFNKAFSDLAVKDEGFCTIGYTNTQNKESYYITYYVLSYDISGFDKIVQEQLTSMDQNSDKNLIELLKKSLN